MKVDVVFLSDFCHGSLNAEQGKSTILDKALAEDLERAGLLRITMAPVAKIAGPATRQEAGKALDDGEGQPSSSSPAAHPLAQRKSKKSGSGVGKRRKSVG